jgi:hypothetical protein
MINLPSKKDNKTVKNLSPSEKYGVKVFNLNHHMIQFRAQVCVVLFFRKNIHSIFIT